MKRAFLFALTLVAAQTAYADDTVTLWGNYYKERSTRVIEPIATVTKDLPSEGQVQATYLVDQITSASGAFGVSADKLFSEYRQEVQLAARKRFLRTLTPGVLLRISHEPDYRSTAVGGELTLSLFRDETAIRGYAQHQTDEVYQRGREAFHDQLSTTLVGLGYTQVLAPNVIGGASIEAQILRGYIQNPYRVENHPRRRNRYSAAIWTAYQYEPTRTTGRIGYRFYADTWKLVGHAIELELTQRIVPELAAVARFRYYRQNDVYFVTLTDNYLTTDPKLFAFNSQLYGLELRWTLAWLRGTALDAFATSQIIPAYSYLDQTSTYGPAHIIQLGWLWPY
jgi:uncharacterized protein DUF3570